MSKSENDLLRRMPKIDTHCHLDGSLRVETVLELAKKQRVRMPADTVEDLRRFVTVAPTCGSLADFLDVFNYIYPLVRDPASVERVAYELIEDCAQENIRHVEVRDAPVIHAHEKFTAAHFVEAALRGLRRGRKDFGVTSGFIIGLFRSHSPKENRVAFDAVKRFYRPGNGLREPGVVGMDLCGDEARFPTMEFADFYREARELGIPTTCHAGETEGTENLQAALDLEVGRIGHGTHLFEDDKLLERVVQTGTPVEVGITSNLRTKSVARAEDHPIREFHRRGVRVSINTDDRGMIDIDLTHEFETALKIGFTFEQLMKLSTDSVDHLFLPMEDRRKLKASFQGEMRALRPAAIR
ncbi:MAG: adenosine deaminase [Elusimicrobiota bacterium]